MNAMYDHCVRVYAEMEKESKAKELEGVEVQVYEGYLTKLFNELGLAVPYYTSVMRDLRRMDCVRQIRRGGGTAPSMWLLVQSPVEENFRAAQAKPIQANRSSRLSSQQLLQMVKDLGARVTVLEERVG